MLIYENSLSSMEGIRFCGDECSIVEWQEKKCLKMNGLVFFPDVQLRNGMIEVLIGADDVTYCGVVFRMRDRANYELVYVQPHTSGRWDALQYDPVFHGSNTWQLYHGKGAQQEASISMHRWHKLRITFQENTALLQLDDQTPLEIKPLAHRSDNGEIVGLWCYKPAYFRELRVWNSSNLRGEKRVIGPKDTSIIDEWFLEDYGRVCGESSHPIVNLNRYLPVSMTDAYLTRRFCLEEDGDVTLDFGFSDEITIFMNDTFIFSGENIFKNSPHWGDQGYVRFSETVTVPLKAGEQQLRIHLKRTEYFGWGFQLALRGKNVKLIQVDY
ncbi:hypothetical protein [Evansella cellulosilytica]|uniref:Uncharacterized protein n=1 Tax=Evansella cellulosilytica (strain ATCC 21833 / DSM 2522 / FERM P-1141 / JCM 9156 / N-4) TaxID=649639 RepID=E6TQA9_EVAC2|nr:hypothetical protein [Evansella cellulosilytica]ADU29287.1 hypothetical protein Bcell_1014 [Evansella cellulosilytica DSM 2522]